MAVTIEIGSTDHFVGRFVNYEQRRQLPTAFATNLQQAQRTRPQMDVESGKWIEERGEEGM